MTKIRPSVLNPLWKRAIADGITKRVAKWAGYDAARPSRTRQQHGMSGTNPNSTLSQIERIQLQFNAEYLAKNASFAIGYIRTRMNYASAQITYAPDTGDTGLDAELLDFCNGVWAEGGINCSMQEAFARAADVEQPVRGDSCLIWLRDETQLRLMEASADQIGELYQFTQPRKNMLDGLTYFSGMFFRTDNGIRQAFRVYERGWNQIYTNPQNYPADDVIYFQDNLFAGVRGVSIFAAVIAEIDKEYHLFQSGMDSARRQAKTAVVVFNEMGMPDEQTYDTITQDNGDLVYAEKMADGAVTEFKFKGDQYQVIRSQAPGPELIEGCRLALEKGSLALALPYSFLVNARDVGGAPSRLEINRADKEMSRIKGKHKRALKKISEVTILDAIERKKFPAIANILRGHWSFPAGPTADAFKDSLDDIKSNRAGLESRSRILARYSENWPTVLRENQSESVDIAIATQEANRELTQRGYKPTITVADIAQNSDNPQQAAVGEAIERGGNPNAPKISNAPSDNIIAGRFAAYMGDVAVGDLPDSAQQEIAHVLGTNGDTDKLRVVKYGMTVPELLTKADDHNIATARKNIRYCKNGDCAQEVHDTTDKHILLVNDKIVDGHHYLAKAEKGRVSKSLPVIDLTPARFQLAALQDA